MFASALVYAGLAMAGSSFLVWVVARLRHRRWAGAKFLASAGLALTPIGWMLPANEIRISAPRTQLDEFVPVYQFNEVHSIEIRAPKEQAYRSIRSVTANEIFLFRTLTWIRRFGRSGSEGILNAPPDVPLLDVALRTSFLKLAELPEQEIVLGTAVVAPPNFHLGRRPTPEDFKSIHEPGFALAAMNFVVEENGPGSCLVRTETRIYATDDKTARRFARYWRVIYPGSALIRRMWLRAVKRRAEVTKPQLKRVSKAKIETSQKTEKLNKQAWNRRKKAS